MRRLPSHPECQLVPGLNVEYCAVRHVLAYVANRAVEADRIRARDRADAVSIAAHPGNDLAVPEPYAQHRLHFDAAFDSLDNPAHDRGSAVPGRHEVGHAHYTAQGVPEGLQDQRIAQVVPADLASPGYWSLDHRREIRQLPLRSSPRRAAKH